MMAFKSRSLRQRNHKAVLPRKWIGMTKLELIERLIAVLALCLVVGCRTDPTAELIEQLGDADVDVRRAAARELADLGRDAILAVPALKGAVQDDDAVVRRLAIHAIGRIGPQAESYLPTLTAALKDDELAVRLAAALAIDRVDPNEESHRKELIAAMRMGEGGIIVAVGQTGENAAWAVPTFIELLGDRRSGIRRITANSLEQIGPAAEAALEKLQRVARQDEDDRVRAAAENAVNSIQTAANE